MAAEKIKIEPTSADKVYPIQYDENYWQKNLSEFEYQVIRNKGTEYAFSGDLNNEKRKGIYYSRATGQPLFSSEHKYDSRTGWPSFWRPIDDSAIDYYVDKKLFHTRIEVTDSSSGAHLGHVFEDGPKPTGLRYCINSVSMIFVAEGEEPPQIVKDYIAKFGASSPALRKSKS
ncbi:MAG: peptide-methionine (R)-S-oxide reductase MsrB [Gammaproteobacteria bacterium]|nr:peptide-methionine (R)-S-oxide reductase MsrB [Gammaproteobacteria bacterium]